MRAIDFTRRSARMFALLTVAVTCAWSAAHAQSWKPEKNVEIVASAAPGGGNDATARLIQKLFQEQRLISTTSSVVNKPGGGGAIAWSYLNQHPGDGHYLSIAVPTLLTNRITGTNALTYTDLTPLANLFSEYILLAVRADSPVQNARDLAERMRKDASSLSIGIATALGNHNHIAAALIARAAGGDARKLRVVVYDAGSKATLAVMGGHVDIVSATASNVLPQLQSGKLRLLGVTAPRRMTGPLAEVPTFREQGTDVVFSSWRAIAGPRGMTPAQVAYWEEVFLRLSTNAEWLEDLRRQSWDSTYMNSVDTRKYLESQNGVMRAALEDAGLAK
jgi:putative tricarboxylic transport membrane protein